MGTGYWVFISCICFLVSCFLIPDAHQKNEKVVAFIIGGPLMWGWFVFIFCWGLIENVVAEDYDGD